MPQYLEAVSTLCYRCRDSSAPAYLSDLLSVYQPSHSLHSADASLMTVPCIKLNKYGKRAFSYIGPVTWNSLPKPLRDAPSLPSFKSSLKRSSSKSICTDDLHSQTHQGIEQSWQFPVYLYIICSMCVRVTVLTCCFFLSYLGIWKTCSVLDVIR